jgi:HK97 family phage major capsid protein
MSATAEEVFDRGHVRVKDAGESYDTKRSEAFHVKTHQPVYNNLRKEFARYPSQLDDARAGVLLKHLGQRSGLFPSVRLSEHERNLLDEMCEDEWAGTVGGEVYDKIHDPPRVKALLDGTTSGGLEITPIFFDDQVVVFPLLTGELLPKVDLRPIDRGRRIEGGSVGNPTISWGQGDDTSVGLFNTADLVAALDSTVYGCAVAIECGRDFLSDAAVNVGAILTAAIGQRMAAELDKVIASGNGTTQPSGILTAAGLGTVSTDNAAAGPPSVNDYLSLLFSIGKQYRVNALEPTFVSNDTTFQRSRAIKIDTATPSTDQRPALAPLSEVNTYRTLGWDHAVQNDIGNRSCVFGALRRYRLYRRVGMEVRWVDGGKELARKNLALLVVRARYAGRVMDANAFAKWTDGQS